MKNIIVLYIILISFSFYDISSVYAEVTSLVRLLPENIHIAIATQDLSATLDLSSKAKKTPIKDIFGVAPEGLSSVIDRGLIRAQLKLNIDEPSNLNTHLADVFVGQFSDPDKISQLLVLAQKQLAKQGAKSKTTLIEGVSATQFKFSSPKATIVHCRYKEYLILANEVDVVILIIQQIKNSTNTNQNIEIIWSKLQKRIEYSNQDSKTPLYWFADSTYWQESDRTILSIEGLDGNSAEKHGLNGIKAIGGIVNIESDGSQVNETLIYAPKPRQSSLKILDLTITENIEIPKWVHVDIEGLVLLYGNLPEASKHIGTLFDSLLADGIDGTYEEVLQDIKNPLGLNIDLQNQFFAHLGPRGIIILGKEEEQENNSTQAILIALETSNSTQVSSAINLLMQDDPEASKVIINNENIWKIDSTDNQSSSAIGVAQGFCFIATDIRLLQQMLNTNAEESLAMDPKIVSVLTDIRQKKKPFPSMLFASGVSRDKTKKRTGNDPVHGYTESQALWKFFFEESGPLVVPDFLFAWKSPFFAGHSQVAFGYLEEDGWLISTPSKDSQQDITSR
ncbi:MAG: hypothetical protein ACKVH8_21125 [Pirellulales bacterium]